MQLRSSLVTTFLLARVVLAAPATTTPVDTAPLSMDTSNMVPRNFTASDGAVHEIWVDAGFNDQDGADLDDVEKRQVTGPSGRYAPKWNSRLKTEKKCRGSSFVGDTGPHAPTSGRCRAIKEWAENNKGYWSVSWNAITVGQYRALLTAKKDGATQCVFGVYHDAYMVRIGNKDIHSLVHTSLSRYKKTFNGVERVRSWGSADCDGDLVENGSAELKWWMTEKFT